MSNINRILRSIFRSALVQALLICSPVHALQTGDSVSYSFTGVLQAMTPCSISSDRVIEVSFGNVGINKVESGIYILPINYSLDCKGVGTANTVLMTLKGVPMPANESMVASGAQGLLLQFYKDSVPLKLNEEFEVPDAHSPPTLEVKLIKDPAENFTEGGFATAVTLMAEFT